MKQFAPIASNIIKTDGMSGIFVDKQQFYVFIDAMLYVLTSIILYVCRRFFVGLRLRRSMYWLLPFVLNRSLHTKRQKKNHILDEYASKDNRIKIYENETNLGFKKKFEKAMSLCNGEYVALCDQDDIWCQNHLELLLNIIGDKMIACGDALLVNADGISMGFTLSWQEAFDYVPNDDLQKAYSIMYFRSPFQGASMLIKKEFLEIALPIPEQMEYQSRSQF